MSKINRNYIEIVTEIYIHLFEDENKPYQVKKMNKRNSSNLNNINS